jgi:hypothetical protein
MNFLLDLWHDLREKRLWPVAVGLLAAAIAIPVLMLKPAGDPAPAPAIAADTGSGETLPAVDVDTSPTSGSKLETFSKRNPFKPLNDLKKEPTTESGSGSGSDSGSGSGSGTGSDSGSSPFGGSDSTGGSSSGGDSTGGGTTPTDTRPVREPMQWFHYTVNVKFGTPTRQKTLKSLDPLAGLPDDSNPAVTFMGVTDDGTSAVFLINDDSLVADGEGTCRDENCTVVELGIDGAADEESFTSTDGTVQYDLQLLNIKREKMDPPADNGKSAASDEDSADTSPTEGKHTATGAGSAVGSAAAPDALPQLIVGPGVELEGQ